MLCARRPRHLRQLHGEHPRVPTPCRSCWGSWQAALGITRERERRHRSAPSPEMQRDGANWEPSALPRLAYTGNGIWGSPHLPGGHPPCPAILNKAPTALLRSRNAAIFSQKEENPSEHFSAFRSQDPWCRANPEQTLAQIIARHRGWCAGP